MLPGPPLFEPGDKRGHIRIGLDDGGIELLLEVAHLLGNLCHLGQQFGVGFQGILAGELKFLPFGGRQGEGNGRRSLGSEWEARGNCIRRRELLGQSYSRRQKTQYDEEYDAIHGSVQ